MNNKENQDGEEPGSELHSVASPKVSGSAASGDPARAEQTFAEAQAFEGWAGGHDPVHWGGVGRRQHWDSTSVASSAVAERDDKSLYALDATEEGEERDQEEEAEEEAPEEITLTQVGGDLRAMQLRSESSNVESAFTAISAAGSLTDVDQMAEVAAALAAAGDLSPRQLGAAAAARSAAQGGGAAAAGGDGGATAAAPAAAAAASTGDTEVGDSVSVAGGAAPPSSAAPSEEGWQGGGSASDLLESAAAPPAAAECTPGAGPAAADEGLAAPNPFLTPAEEAEAEAGPVAATAEPEPPAAEAQPDPTNPFLASAEGEAAELVAAADGGVQAASSSRSAADTAAAAAAARADSSGPSYPQSFVMQPLSAATSEDDLTVYSADQPAMAGFIAEGEGEGQAAPAPVPASHQMQPLAAPTEQHQQQQQQSGAAPAAAPAAAAMEPLSVEAGGGMDGAMSPTDTAAALAAINQAASSPSEASGQQQAQQQQSQQVPLLFPPQWYQTFKGLLYMDGVDALGRPVVVVNADAVPANMKSSALVFIKAHLEPLVNQGDYVLVFTSQGVAKLPSMWIMGAYRSLPRPFRKNVQYVVLVRPSGFLRTVLAFMRRIVSTKAARKIKQVQSLHEIKEATSGEVTLQSLGAAFTAEHLAEEEALYGGGSSSDALEP